MTAMLVQVHARDTDRLLKFFVSELALFNVAFDYGMGNYLLTGLGDPHMGLQIVRADDQNTFLHPLFTVAVQNIEPLFHRLKGIDFLSGGELLTGPTLFEYPAGKSMLLRDPGGNRFLIEEHTFGAR